jgi:surface antigen
MPTCTRILCGLSAVLLFANVANAANLGFLRDTPISRMQQADFDSLTHAVRAALDDKHDGETANWTNEGLRNRVRVEATITPATTATQGDNTCRTTVVVITSRQQSMTLRPRFCREGKGEWVFQQTH